MQPYDLLVVGSGSGNMLPEDAIAGLRVAIVERGDFGGTCLNRGCLPSKMFVHTADIATAVRTAGRFGVQAELRGVDWLAVRERVFARVDSTAQRGLDFRRDGPVDVLLGEAHFTGPRTLEIDGREVSAHRILLAAGSRPQTPPIDGLDGVAFHTSDTIMRIDALPASMVIVGGGPVAAEMSHVFGALGTEVTIVHQGPRLLDTLDTEIAQRFTDIAATRGAVWCSSVVTTVARDGDGVSVTLKTGDETHEVRAGVLLIATGRVPNTDALDVARAGIDTDEHGHVVTDAACATSAPGVWAIGDLANHYQLKHVANDEMQVALYNALHDGEPRRTPHRIVPSAVFTNPQVASVGPTERTLREAGVPYAAARHDYADTGYGWALEDTTGFFKVLADPDSGLILGAHAIGPDASIILQPLVQAMSLGTTVAQLAHDVLYIHPALTELVAQTLLEFPDAISAAPEWA